MRGSVFVAAAFVALFSGAPAHATELVFTATLSGDEHPTATGSAATGEVTLRIDPDLQTIDADVTVHGIRFGDLAAHLAHRPVGPAHLHRYAPDGEVALIAPFPFGTTYVERGDGFTITMRAYPYVEAASTVQSELSFEAFLASMAEDPIYFNIHTNAFPDGEISGLVTRAE